MKGVVKKKFQEKGFGFIACSDDGKDYFFHRSAVSEGHDFEILQVGDKVEFEPEQTPKGLQATKVRLSGGPVRVCETGVPPSAPKEYHFLNPYNFVRFLPAPPEVQPEDAEGLRVAKTLLGRCSPPPQDRYVGLSGTITCRLKSLSPLFVSDAHDVGPGEAGADPKHRSYRFFQVGGQYAIPGSSLRGMVRSVFEAVTGSCMICSGTNLLSRHASLEESLSLWPARVVKQNEGLALQVLNGTQQFHAEAPDRREPAPAAWLLQYDASSPRRNSTCDRHPGSKYCMRQLVSLPASAVHGSRCWALIERMEHPGKPIKFWNVLQLAHDRKELPNPATADQKVAVGYLCLNNKNFQTKHDERFFFSLRDSGDDESAPPLPAPIALQKEHLHQYQQLVRSYQERHEREAKKQRKPGFRIPNRVQDAPMLSRFILDSRSRLEEGDLVYVSLKTDGQGAASIRFLAPVSVPRVFYDRSVAQIIEQEHASQKACCDANSLCSACRLFGWVHPNGRGMASSEQAACRGRVRFSHALRTKAEGKPFSAILAILSSPKPTTVGFYLMHCNGAPPTNWTEAQLNQGYDGKVQLRGRKAYRRHKARDLSRAYGQQNRHEYEHVAGMQGEQNRTVRDALPEGNQFTFTVDFDSLSEIELGALLWSLALESGWTHRLGYAKPLGFGSVQVAVESVQVRDARSRYGSLSCDGIVKWDRTTTDGTVALFRKAIGDVFGSEFANLPTVLDLQALFGPQGETLPPIHYPRSTLEPQRDGKNFKWFMTNKKSHGLGLPLAENDNEGLPYF